MPIDVPTKPNSEIKIPSDATTLSGVNLPAGWQWEDSSLLVDNLTSATAIYVGENKSNYKNTTIIINLQKKESVDANPDNQNCNNNNYLKQNSPDTIQIITVSLAIGERVLYLHFFCLSQKFKKRKNKIII